MKTPDIRRIDFEIPIHWTGEQAFAVFELINDMRETILAYYGREIAEQMAEERADIKDLTVIDEEDIPF